MKLTQLVSRVTVNGSCLVVVLKKPANTKGLANKRFRLLLNGQRIALSGTPRLSGNAAR